MTSNDSIPVLTKRVGFILVLLWILLAGLYFFVPRLAKGNDKKADSLANSFTHAYADLIYGGNAVNLSYEVKNWKYEKKQYKITVKMECLDSVNVNSEDPNRCKAVMTFLFTMNENDKLVNFKRLDGNPCALRLGDVETTRNAIRDIPKFQSKMDEFSSKQ